MEIDIKIDELDLSDGDHHFLISTVLPKTKKNLFWVCIIFIVLIPIMPYFPARITGRTLIERMNYESAVILSCFLNGLIIFLVYHFGIKKLRRDINHGTKCSYKTHVKKKVLTTNATFELELECRPKNMNEKIFIDKKEFYNWFKGDSIKIEYLKKSGILLGYTKS